MNDAIHQGAAPPTMLIGERNDTRQKAAAAIVEQQPANMAGVDFAEDAVRLGNVMGGAQ
jgi:hypothetical protein